MSLHFCRAGEGPPLLFLHGLFDSLHTWDPLIPYLSNSYTTYSVDLPGFGKSPLPPQWTQSLSQTVEALIQFLNQMQLSKITVVGSSMGGGMAFALAQRRPDLVDRLILINPYALPFLPEAVTIARNGIFRSVLPYFLVKWVLKKVTRSIYRRSFYNVDCITTDLIEEAVTPFLKIEQKKDLFRFLNGISLDEINQIDRLLPTLTQPTEILWGTHDRWLSFEHAERLQKRLPHCNVTLIPESGHLPHFEKPNEVAHEIRRLVSDGEVPSLVKEG
ncbi:MAG: alpha/beta hydrolase [Nitrospirota bacterium]